MIKRDDILAWLIERESTETGLPRLRASSISLQPALFT